MRKYFLILALAGFLLYLPSLFGPFVWDDEDFVYANVYVANFQIDKFFTQSITEGRNKGSNYFRPVQEIAYATTHTAFGFNPFWFHLLNVLVHIGASCAIFYFFYLLIKQNKNAAGGRQTVPLNANASGPNSKSSVIANEHFKVSGGQDPRLTAFLISLIFLIHPIQTEAVSYISGLSDPLYVLFGFLSLIFFRLKDERKNMVPLSVFFFVLSILAKETGLVFLPLLLALSYLQSVNLDKNIFKDSWKFVTNSWKSLLPFALCSMLYLWYHTTNINTFDVKSAWGNNPYANSILVRLLTFVQNLFLYVQLLIFPKDLFMERDYSIPIQTNLLNPYSIIFIILNAALIFGIWKLKTYLKIENWKLKILIFCYLAFFLSFIPYTGVVLINGIFYEHFLYLPLVFFFAFIILVIASVAKQSQTKTRLPRRLQLLAMTVFFIWLIALATRNISRQFDWNDAIRFYSQTLSHAPKSIRIINGLGMAQADKGDFNSAIATYNHGLSVDPNVPNLYHNLANAEAAQGNTSLAEKYYLKALEVNPNFLFSAQSLANLYQQTGQKEKLQSLIKKYSH